MTFSSDKETSGTVPQGDVFVYKATVHGSVFLVAQGLIL
jgi:hypothetical protein